MRLPLSLLFLAACSQLTAPGAGPDDRDPREVRLAGLSGLILSEVMDHPTDGYKYVEVCNRSTRDIDLTDVLFERFANGNTEGTAFTMSGILASGEAVVLVGSGGSDAFAEASGTGATFATSVVSGNGDDAYRIRHGDTVLDVFGAVGVDGTGQPWEYTDSVVHRDEAVGAGEAAWLSDQWTLDPNAAGTPFECGDPIPDPVSPPPPVLGGLLLSEVMDHADQSSLKYVEICNRSATTLTLEGAELHRYSNGDVEPDRFPLGAVVLAPGEAHVVVNPSGADAYRQMFDREPDAQSGVATGNGDDTYALFIDGEMVDVYGTIGVDGSFEPWEYADQVAVRAGNTFVGQTSWSADEWAIIGVGAANPGDCAGDVELPPPGEDPDDDCPDGDGDGYGDCIDCDDTSSAVYPGAPERCDGVDNNCDGITAEGDEDANNDGLLDCEVCDQEGLWVPTRNLYGSALRSYLSSFSSGQTCGWSSSRRKINGLIDDDNGTVHCVYTDTTAPARSDTTTGNINIEHTWPQSLGASAWPAKCDMHHLYPTDMGANSARSSHPFGVPDAWDVSWQRDGSRLGRMNGEWVFEPPDDHKGNVARSLFYMSTTYGFWMDSAYLQRMKTWHQLDPVDLDELDRTERIAAEQGTVNPLVACPHLVDRL